MNLLKKTIFYFLFITLTGTLYANDSIKVLILNSWSPDHEWVQGEVQGIKDSLRKKHKKIEFTTEYISHPRIQGVDKEKYMKSFHRFFDTKYINSINTFDMVFVTDDPALDYMLEYHDLYFPEVPVIFSGINNYKPEKMKDKRGLFFGVLETVDYFGTLDIAHKLHPNAKRFYILGDQTRTSQSQIEEIKKISSKFPLEFVYLDDLTFEQLAKELNSLTKDDIVFLLAFYSDSTGKQLSPDESIDFLKKNLNAPLYTFWKWQMGRGSVMGGKVLSSYEHGQAAVERFYMNDKKKRMLVVGGENPYIFNFDQLEKFEISLESLPLGSKIINKPFSFYETYKVLVNIMIAFISILIVFVIVLLLNIRRRKIIESNLKSVKKELEVLNRDLEQKVSLRTSELSESNDELEQTIENLKLTQNKLVESEKMASLGTLVAGVAHEINTPVGIGLTGITHFLDITGEVENKYAADKMTQNEFENYLKTSKELAIHVNTNLERVAFLIKSFKEISPNQIKQEKTTFDIRTYVEDVLIQLKNIIKTMNLTIEIEAQENMEINSYPHIYSQIFSQLILNSIRHAYKEKDKGTITINMKIKNSTLEILYKDDGKGISSENLAKIFEPFFTTNRTAGGKGLGLNVVYNSVQSLNGAISCDSKEGEGVIFKISVPL